MFWFWSFFRAKRKARKGPGNEVGVGKKNIRNSSFFIYLKRINVQKSAIFKMGMGRTYPIPPKSKI